MNRDPEEDEIATCMPFIERQIGIIAPKVIVSLGRISAHTLTGTTIPISRLRGTFYEYRGIPLMPTFHPAYLLRNPNAKWDVWNDMQKVLERLKGEKK
jgi:DNA polymerase